MKECFYEVVGISKLQLEKILMGEDFQLSEEDFEIVVQGTFLLKIFVELDEQRKRKLSQFSSFFISEENKTFVEMLVAYLTLNHLTISTAESITGGMISAYITSVPGASKVLKESFVVYAEDSKIKTLGVHPSTIVNVGVVSSEVAREMVEGLYKQTSADVCISVTGVAGPTSDERNNQVGLSYIGLKVGNHTEVAKFLFVGTRDEIRTQVVKFSIAKALQLSLHKETV